jgi:hypothetical protein
LGFVDRLARARIGETYNQYAGSSHLRERLGFSQRRRAPGEVVKWNHW